MIRFVAGAILLIALGAACSDEPEIGGVEDLVVQGPAGRLGDAEPLEIVTYRQSLDGRSQACWGLRPERAGGNQDHGYGSCIDAGGVRALASTTFVETAGPLPHGLVTPEAAVVRAGLADGGTVEMKPYDYPDLDAKVFGFSLPDTEKVTRLLAVSGSGEVLGFTDDLP